MTEVLPMQKKYVSVNAEVDTDGVIHPLLICLLYTSDAADE